MAGPEILQTLMSTATPVLPGTVLLRLALPLMWAIVLAGCVFTLGVKLPNRWRLGLTGLIAVWALIPGPVSITFWLGLAFQMPSLMTLLICAGWLVKGLTRQKPVEGLMPKSGVGLVGYSGIVLGWLLLLDTLAVLPWSIYSQGFGMAAPAAVSVLVVLLWTVKCGPGGRSYLPTSLTLTGLALVLFVATRLPTGNLWDALLDPWLWLVLQVVWLRRLVAQRHISKSQ